MKTDEQIALEIATLDELSKLLPPTIFDAPGNSQHVIAAQIDVLAFRLTSDHVHDGYLKSTPDDMFLDLLYASDWAHDLLPPMDGSPPSADWRDQVKYEDGVEGVDERARAAFDQAVAGLTLAAE